MMLQERGAPDSISGIQESNHSPAASSPASIRGENQCGHRVGTDSEDMGARHVPEASKFVRPRCGRQE